MIVLIPILLCVGFLLAYEVYAIGTGKKLVTIYIREAFAVAPGPFMVVAFVMGVLFGHFFWGA